MNDAFDEFAIWRRSHRRRFVYQLHQALTAILIIITFAIIAHLSFVHQSSVFYVSYGVVWRDLVLFMSLWLFPLLFHGLWFRYKQAMDNTLVAEMSHTDQYKRKNEDYLPYLEDTGEFVPSEEDEDYPQKRFERR